MPIINYLTQQKPIFKGEKNDKNNPHPTPPRQTKLQS